MKKIDAHQHFWHYNEKEYAWITDAMPQLKQHRKPEDLKPLLQQHNFDGCIAVQARQSIEENHFLITLAKKHPWILGVVGWIDICSNNLSDELAQWEQYPIMKGYRHLVQDENDPCLYLQNQAFNQGIDLILNKGLVYELLIHAKSLHAATKFCARHDQSFIVLDHVGKPNIKNGDIKIWKKQILPLASQSHVYCKLSGLITEADIDWHPDQIKPYIDVALELFGPNRLLFGSDWPVCLLAGQYTQVYQLISQQIKQLTPNEQSAIWGENATKIYKLS